MGKTDSKFLTYLGFVCDKALTTPDVLSEKISGMLHM